MSLPDLRYTPGRVPDGYHAVAITAEQRQASLRVCVLVRGGAGGGAGYDAGGALVLVRTHVDARVYLGCVTDAGGFVHEWAEVWVQSSEGLIDSIPAYRDALLNHALDQRWMAQVRAYERFERPVLIRTGYETARPPVTFIELAPKGASAPAAVHPMEQDGEGGGAGAAWELCEDDGLLVSAQLPPYSTTLHRYLHVARRGAETNFVVVSAGSPTNARTRSLGDLFPGRASAGLAALNPGAGLLMVRRAGTLALPAYVELLSGGGGGSAAGVAHGRTTVSTGLSAPGTAAAEASRNEVTAGDGGLFLGQQGKWGRLIEAMHLKARVVADAIGAVRSAAEVSQRPVFSVSPESFHVYMGEAARGLPQLWSARVSLVDPGDAIALPIRASDAQYYISPSDGKLSIYRPSSAGMATRGVASLRIRQILNASAESLVLEGTLSTDQRLRAEQTDLVWVRVTLGGGMGGAAGGRLDLYGRLESDAALAAGEWRFRTIGQRFSAGEVGLLQSATGVPLAGSYFEVIPLIATPVDLYALAVLATKVLLTDAKTSLAVVLDEMLSLARQVAEEHDASVPLAERVGAIIGSDPRWVEALGPHRLTTESIKPQEAFDLVPASLWWETLAAIIRMFPGVGPDSTCRGPGDAPFGGMHLVFDRARDDFDRLLRKTRSLIVIDWNYNREIHAVVRQYSAGVGSGPSRG